LPETAASTITTAASTSAAARLPQLRAAAVSTSAPAVLGRLAQGSRRVFLSTIGLVILAVLWQVLPSEHILDPTFVSPLSQVLSTWWHLAAHAARRDRRPDQADRPDRNGFDELQGAVRPGALVRLDRPHQPRPGRLEHRHDRG
jgi:hypothetical protein